MHILKNLTGIFLWRFFNCLDCNHIFIAIETLKLDFSESVSTASFIGISRSHDKHCQQERWEINER